MNCCCMGECCPVYRSQDLPFQRNRSKPSSGDEQTPGRRAWNKLTSDKRSQSSAIRQISQSPRDPDRDNCTGEFDLLVFLSSGLAGSIRVYNHTRQRDRLQRRDNTAREWSTAELAEQWPLHHENALHRKRALHDLQRQGPDEQSHGPVRGRLSEPLVKHSCVTAGIRYDPFFFHWNSIESGIDNRRIVRVWA